MAQTSIGLAGFVLVWFKFASCCVGLVWFDSKANEGQLELLKEHFWDYKLAMLSVVQSVSWTSGLHC